MEKSVEALLMRLKDSDDFLNLFINEGQITVSPDNLSEFLVRGIMGAVCNQAAIMTYLLEKEGHQGLPGNVTITKEGE